MPDEFDRDMDEATPEQADLEILNRKIHTLEADGRELRARLKKAYDDIELERKRADEAARIGEPAKVKRYRPRRTKKGGRSRAIAGNVFSDWHVEERVDFGQTNGLNEYNPEISQQRGENAFERLVWLIEQQRKGLDIDTLVCSVLGDMITGFIHEDFRQTNYLSPTEAVRFVRGLLYSGLDYLLEQKDLTRIIVPCVWGNHGRTNTDRELIGAAMRNSYEAMMYWDLRDHYEGEERIEIEVAEGQFIYTNVEGYMIRHMHGNMGIGGYQGGVGGLSVPIMRNLPRLDKGITADLTVMGHWHQMLDLGHVFVNGSLIGNNAYSNSRGFAPEPAQQAFYLFDPKSRRRLMGAPIFVEPPGEWQKRREKAAR